MTKLEKSVRSAMSFYGAKLRAGGWYMAPGATGDIPKAGYLAAAYADYDPEAGVVTDIRLYTSGDAYLRRDMDGSTIDISEAVLAYLEEYDWGALIASICDVCEVSAAEKAEA